MKSILKLVMWMVPLFALSGLQAETTVSGPLHPDQYITVDQAKATAELQTARQRVLHPSDTFSLIGHDAMANGSQNPLAIVTPTPFPHQVPQSSSGTLPIANNMVISTPFQIPIAITLVGNDPNGLPLTYLISANPANGILSTISGNQITYTPNANFSGPDSFTYKTINSLGQESIPATVSIDVGQPVSSSSETVTTYVYERAFSSTRIRVNTHGFKLVPSQWAEIQALLDLLPPDHLTGLQEINLEAGVPTPATNYSTNSTMTMNVLTDPSYSMVAQVSQGLGQRYYQFGLGPQEQKDWADLTLYPDSALAAAAAFGSIYSDYVSNTVDAQVRAIGNRAAGDIVPSNWAKDSLPLNLFMAAVFSNSKKPQVNYSYKYASQTPLDYQMDYRKVGRDSNWLQIGSYYYELEGNKIIGLTSENPYRTSSGMLQATFVVVWPNPVEIPQTVLNRIQLRS